MRVVAREGGKSMAGVQLGPDINPDLEADSHPLVSWEGLPGLSSGEDNQDDGFDWGTLNAFAGLSLGDSDFKRSTEEQDAFKLVEKKTSEGVPLPELPMVHVDWITKGDGGRFLNELAKREVLQGLADHLEIYLRRMQTYCESHAVTVLSLGEPHVSLYPAVQQAREDIQLMLNPAASTENPFEDLWAAADRFTAFEIGQASQASEADISMTNSAVGEPLPSLPALGGIASLFPIGISPATSSAGLPYSQFTGSVQLFDFMSQAKQRLKLKRVRGSAGVTDSVEKSSNESREDSHEERSDPRENRRHKASDAFVLASSVTGQEAQAGGVEDKEEIAMSGQVNNGLQERSLSPSMLDDPDEADVLSAMYQSVQADARREREWALSQATLREQGLVASDLIRIDMNFEEDSAVIFGAGDAEPEVPKPEANQVPNALVRLPLPDPGQVTALVVPEAPGDVPMEEIPATAAAALEGAVIQIMHPRGNGASDSALLFASGSALAEPESAGVVGVDATGLLNGPLL